jgi:Holliday junction resolvase RusA-like endonuclease
MGINMRTPEKTKTYEHLVQSCARNAMASGIPVLTGPLEIDISFAFQGDWLKQHTKKPDVDNCVKSVLDALNGIVWEDDAQIVSLLARKEYEVDASATISVTQL